VAFLWLAGHDPPSSRLLYTAKIRSSQYQAINDQAYASPELRTKVAAAPYVNQLAG
jgi:hypothetical protein